ncbi:MAG: hypothetical protein R2789_12800 [Microthrixaceae bacterium]
MTAEIPHPESDTTPIHGRAGFRTHLDRSQFPEGGMPSEEAYELLHTGLMLDGRETLNLASFVTTWMEPEAEQLIQDTLRKNHIDHDEYPAASLIEEGVCTCWATCSTLRIPPRSSGSAPSDPPRRSCSGCWPTRGHG